MEKKEKNVIIAGVAVLLLCVAGFSVYAVKKSNEGRRGNQLQGPSMNGQPFGKSQPNIPAEVATACQGKVEGDTCEATSPQGSDKQSGTCTKMGNNDQLICLPANMPARPNGGGNRPAPTQGGVR
jgi:hypothetical protein